MKRSELKEAIKAEIKSVLSEEIQVGDMVTIGDGKRKYEVINVEKGFMSDIDDVEVKSMDGMPIGSSNPNVGSKTATYKATQLRLAEIAFGAANTDKRTGQVAGEIIELIRSTGVDPSDMMEIIGEEFGISFEFGRVSFADIRENDEEDLKEESRFPTQADIDDIENSGNIDIAYDKAMKLLKSLMNKSVSFSDIREGTWSSGTYNEIGRFIQDVKNLKDKYYNIVGNDDVFDGLDRAEESAREMMINAPENRSDLNEDEMSDEEKDKAASKEAKKKDSIATISNKLQKVTSEIKKHLAMYKDAEGDEAKKLAINMLKKLNAEKKKLEKSL